MSTKKKEVEKNPFDLAAQEWVAERNRLIELRIKKGISNLGLAKLSGVDFSRLYRIFSGENLPSVVTYLQIKRALEQ